jgi:hypothetical protein
MRSGKDNVMSKKKKKAPSNLELAQSIRRDWNGINPVTRVIESKKNKPIKHKKREMERASDT